MVSVVGLSRASHSGTHSHSRAHTHTYIRVHPLAAAQTHARTRAPHDCGRAVGGGYSATRRRTSRAVRGRTRTPPARSSPSHHRRGEGRLVRRPVITTAAAVVCIIILYAVARCAAGQPRRRRRRRRRPRTSRPGPSVDSPASIKCHTEGAI